MSPLFANGRLRRADAKDTKYVKNISRTFSMESGARPILVRFSKKELEVTISFRKILTEQNFFSLQAKFQPRKRALASN